MGHKKEDFSQRTETYEALWFTPGLVEPLATFTFQGGDYLILPWADGGSLADLWAANPMPQKITPELCRWTSSQFEELVRAISMSTQLGPAAAEMGITGPGQYGNLQPEDILCFRREVSCGGVTDFDLRILNIRATTPHDQAAAAWSAPYSPPDFGIGSLTPRASDYWALGCIYLEFTTWLLLGYKAVEEFTKARRMDYGDGSTLNEMFFFLSRRYRGGLCPKVKPVVTQWCARLQNHSSCTAALRDFLRFIEHDMLVVEPYQDSMTPKAADDLGSRGPQTVITLPEELLPRPEERQSSKSLKGKVDSIKLQRQLWYLSKETRTRVFQIAPVLGYCV
ncbi:hypothetical protein RB601_005690 [Gaeumannomyces tritici]